jgi:glucokinase
VTFLAVDVGGTKILAGIVDDAGRVHSHERVATPRTGVWDAIAGVVRRQLDAAPSAPVACGVGCGGPMTLGGERVSNLHITEWDGFPLRSRLAALTGLPTWVDNDAKALALGEAWCGAAVGERDFVAMVVSTGVGGGIVSRGELLDGRDGNGGHIGHVIVEPDGRECKCGARGCLEAVASGTAIEALTGRPAAEAGPDVVARTGRYVGRALASTGAIVDLRLAVIGGSVALGYGEPFFAAVRGELSRAARISFIRDFAVVPVGLGPLSPLVGAAAVARRGTRRGGPGGANLG